MSDEEKPVNLNRSTINSQTIVGVLLALAIVAGNQFLINQKNQIVKEVVENAVQPLQAKVQETNNSIQTLRNNVQELRLDIAKGAFDEKHFNAHMDELMPFIDYLRGTVPELKNKPINYFYFIDLKVKK